MSEASEEQARQRARIRRRQAWDMLRDTRNPRYVWMQYPEFDLAKLEEACANLPEPEPQPYRQSAGAARCRDTLRRAADLVPESVRRRMAEREPGEDDECEHGDDPTRCPRCNRD